MPRATEIQHELLLPVARRFRGLVAALDVEVAVVVPVLGGTPGMPVLVAAGTGRAVTVEPATVFRPALRLRADGVILAHNHLATPLPSAADHAVTRRLAAVGGLVGLPLLAHLVVSERGWVDCTDSRSTLRPFEAGRAA